jgi:hypothetical protein
MADENTLAATPDVTKTETPVNDGFIDLDAAETPEPETDDDGEPRPKAEEPKPEGDDEKKKLSGSARAKLREQRLLNELSARDRELEELRSKVTPAAKVGEEEKPPREEDFNGDFFAYQRALTAFEAGRETRKALREDREAREQSERTTKQASIVRERDTAHLERVEDAREVIADFDQVMKSMDGVQIRNDVVDEIKSSENSALLAYYLAKNPEKLNALNSMSGRELAREMGRLEATVKMPEAKKATTAPAPLSTVKGGAAPHSQDADLAAYLKRTYG